MVFTFSEEAHAPQIKRDSKTDPDLGGAFAGAFLLADHLLFLAVQNSSIGDLVPCLLAWSGTTNNQSFHNKTELP